MLTRGSKKLFEGSLKVKRKTVEKSITADARATRLSTRQVWNKCATSVSFEKMCETDAEIVSGCFDGSGWVRSDHEAAGHGRVGSRKRDRAHL